MTTIVEVDEMNELDEQIPIKQEKWMSYETDEETEELYEGQFALFEDKNPFVSRDDYRFLNSETDDSFPDDSNISQPASLNKSHKSCLWVIDVVEHWLSDNELDNPYFAFRPNHQFNNKGDIIRTNPNISDTYQLNKVQRKHTDRVTTYMGDPSYIQDVQDKLLYLDLTCVTSNDQRVSIKIFAPQYNKYYNKQMSQFKWVYHQGNKKLYIPAKYNGKQWNIDTFNKNSENFIRTWIRSTFNVQVNIYNAPYINGYTFKSYRDITIDDEEVIKKVNSIVRNYNSHKAISTPNQLSSSRV
jgi:hypothetical protein